MVRVKLKDDQLIVSGHGNNQAIIGNSQFDLVCAGVSAIVLGAAYCWKNCSKVDYYQKTNGYIAFKFKHDCLTNDLQLQSQLILLLKQLTILSIHYPQQIMITNHIS